MRLIVLLALIPAALSQLQPEYTPRPSVKGFSTIRGVCDPASGGAIDGAQYSGADGTLKACTKKCAENGQCRGLNFVTDQNQCLLFREECQKSRVPAANEPSQNFYLKGQIECTSSTVGNEFYVAFMANRVSQPKNMSLEIWLTQDRSIEPVTVQVEIDPSQSLSPLSVAVPYKEAVLFQIPFTWKVSDIAGDSGSGVAIEKKALRFSAQNKIDFVLYGINKEYYTADAFLGIPSRLLGTRYVANCHWPPYYNCEFSITPSSPDTTVTITLPRRPARNMFEYNNYQNLKVIFDAPEIVSNCAIPYNGHVYTNGDTFEIKLQVFEVAQIQDPCDLTGALIESDKPIAVWSGNSRVNVGDSPSRDHQVEQLFSSDTWGTDCAAWPAPSRAPGLVDYWVITAAEDGTTITVDSTERESVTYKLNAGQSVRLPANSVTEYMRFSSPQKFQAVQYSSSAVDNSIPGDPSMTVCIPTDQYGFGYTFVTPTGVATTYTNYLTIITAKSAVDGFILDGQPLIDIEWNPFPNSNMVGGFVKLSSRKQQFRIEHRVKGTTFEAYIYGSGDRESYAYPTGSCIQALGECVPSTMVVADGKDNDCDGVIDEELCDGLDNDLDGKIDEDCYDKVVPVAPPQDRCPAVIATQACYGRQLQLSCDDGAITIISAHFGRLGRLGESACGSENVLSTCSGSDVNCGFDDISKHLSAICNGQQACSTSVSYYALGNMFMKSPCQTCSLYAHVQYTCLNAKETSYGVMSGQNYIATSALSSGGSTQTCTAGTCPGCSSILAPPADVHRPDKADIQATGRRGWRPATCDKDSWIQVDLAGHFSVGWYAISGCRLTDHWVATFGISYSTDGVTFKEIRETTGTMKAFTGNSDALVANVCTLFTHNIVARWIRVHPLTWNVAPCVHIEFGHNATMQGCWASVPNSNFARRSSAPYGTVATIKCDKGWALQNGATSYDNTCNADGRWSSALLPCNRLLTCPDIPQIDGGYAIAPNTMVGTSVQYACLPGRRLRGANTITCTPEGKWSAYAPTCEQL